MKVPENFHILADACGMSSTINMGKGRGHNRIKVEMSNDPKILRLRRLVYDIILEIHKMRGFVRLSLFTPYVLYGF